MFTNNETRATLQSLLSLSLSTLAAAHNGARCRLCDAYSHSCASDCVRSSALLLAAS